MSFIKIWIHLVLTTKNKQPLLTKDIRHQVFKRICENAPAKNIYIDFINGHTEHIHCLFLLNYDQNITTITQFIKDESSYLINNDHQQKFEWEDEYFAVSVSESGIDKIREHIKNQDAYHQKKTFQQEYEELLETVKSLPGFNFTCYESHYRLQ